MKKGNEIKSLSWESLITSSPDVLRGKPRIKGTRIPVCLILGYLASGFTNNEILTEFPDLKLKHIYASLAYAQNIMEHEYVAV